MPATKKPKPKKHELIERLRKDHPEISPIVNEFNETAPGALFLLLGKRDGAAQLAARLPKVFKPVTVAKHYAGAQRVWELFGSYFLALHRHHEASTLFMLLYVHLLNYQLDANKR